jgi:hypothetical protein
MNKELHQVVSRSTITGCIYHFRSQGLGQSLLSRAISTNAVSLLLVEMGAMTVYAQPAIIDATFDTQPLGPLGTQPRTDPLPLRLPGFIIRDTQFDRVDAANPVGDFSSRVMLLDATAGNLSDATFFNPVQYTQGKYSVSWDSLVTQAPVGIYQAGVILADFNGGAPSIVGLWYDPSGAFGIGASDFPAKYHLVGAYSVGQQQHFQFLLDLDAHSYRLLVNNTLLDSGALFDPAGFALTAFDSTGRASAGDPPPIAVDNVLVRAVPEPSALVMAVLGIAFIGLGAHRRRTTE